MLSIKTIALAATFAVMSATLAQAISFGEFEYQNSCAACHGASGKGDGPMMEFLQGGTPSNLTILQKNNGGVFPVTTIYEVIEGSEAAGSHGTQEMPIWGNRFRMRVDPADDPTFTPEVTEAYVRTRILSLIEYLSTIQEE